MHSFDFLSDSPKYFIFQRSTNKTNLGGVLFIIYLLIMLSIIFVYLYDYFYDIYSNNAYIIESSIIEEVIENDKEELLKRESETNPVLNFSIEFYDNNFNKLSENFIAREINGKEIKRNSIFSKKVSEFGFDIYYYCHNGNCTLKENDTTFFNYWVVINYTGFKIDHQTEGIPLQNGSNIFQVMYPFFFKFNSIRKLYWSIIKYNDQQKGFNRLYDNIMGENKIYYAGSIDTYTDYYDLDKDFYGYDNYNNLHYSLLERIIMINHQDKIIEYKRTKKSFLDILANIGALFSSIYTIFNKIFVFLYSKNFDNYKIIDKILSNKKKINIELSNDSKNFKFSINNPIMETNLIINDKDEEDPDNSNDYQINEEKKDSEKKKLNNNFPKFRLWDFLFLNIYSFANCKNSFKYNFLSKCNEILYKYISIDNILYNQIKLENLLKDYNWNNPNLSNIENNEMIIELKKNIKYL